MNSPFFLISPLTTVRLLSSTNSSATQPKYQNQRRLRIRGHPAKQPSSAAIQRSSLP